MAGRLAGESMKPGREGLVVFFHAAGRPPLSLAMPPSFLPFLSFFLLILLHPSAQSIVPPLQWINLTSLIQSTNGPPALKDAAIGYDDSR